MTNKKLIKYSFFLFHIFLFFLFLLIGNNGNSDYNIYKCIYTVPFDYWWNSGIGYFYSPFFFILFFPFFIITNFGYIICQIGTFILIQYLAIKNKRWDIPFLFNFFLLMDINVGNIDIFISLIIILMRLSYIKHKWHGIIIGLLLFKPSVILIILYFGLDFKKIDIQFWISLLIGLFMNYWFFIIRIDIIPSFITQITLKNDHTLGLLYMIGIQYPWHWWTIGDFTYWKIQKYKIYKKNHLILSFHKSAKSTVVP
jgi:hypothetical protein